MPNPGERVRNVRLSEDSIHVELEDGRDWPDLDEDLSTEGLLQGAPAPRGREIVRG